MQLTRKKIHEQAYYYILILIAVSLPLSIYTSSMFVSILATNWVVEGRYIEKWKRIRHNRALQVFLLIFALHLVGLLWSEDLAFGLKLVKLKLPLLALPVIIASSASLDRSRVHRILLLFSFAVFVATMASLMKLAGWLPGDVTDYRELSLFVHHIHFSVMLVFSLLISFYFLLVQKERLFVGERIYHLVIVIWFPVFLILLKSLSGIMVAGLLSFFILFRLLFEIRDQVYRYMALVAVLMIPLMSILYLNHAIEKYYTTDELIVGDLDQYTLAGNLYEHHPEKRDLENGHYVWIYVCDTELEQEWNRKSEIDYHGRTLNGNSLRTTLIRYLSSRGLRKDAEGVEHLSDKDVKAIEEGIANHIYLMRFRLYPRIYEVIWEFDHYGKGYPPNNKSIVQRYLYLQAGWAIARDNLLTGVGNGDVMQEFMNYYKSIDSPLAENQRRVAHNQYLTELIAFGLGGLLIFLVALVAPLFLARQQRSYMAAGFLTIIMLVLLSADAFDSSTGTIFVGLFYSLFLFGPDYPWLRSKTPVEDG